MSKHAVRIPFRAWITDMQDWEISRGGVFSFSRRTPEDFERHHAELEDAKSICRMTPADDQGYWPIIEKIADVVQRSRDESVQFAGNYYHYAYLYMAWKHFGNVCISLVKLRKDVKRDKEKIKLYEEALKNIAQTAKSSSIKSFAQSTLSDGEKL